MVTASAAIEEGLISPTDGIMKLGMNHPMGPLALADFIGLDICLAILRVLQDGFGDPQVTVPAPCSSKMVDAGYSAEEFGRGFYEYDASCAFAPGHTGDDRI